MVSSSEFFEQYLYSYSLSNSFSTYNDEFKIALSIDIEDNLVEVDLSDSDSDSDTCHFLVGGLTITENRELVGISTWGINFSLDIHQIVKYMSNVENMQILDIEQYSQNLKILLVSQ